MSALESPRRRNHIDRGKAAFASSNAVQDIGGPIRCVDIAMPRFGPLNSLGGMWVMAQRGTLFVVLA